MATSFRTPLARARNLGSAKDGVHHWKLQRVTSISELLLEIWFVTQLIRMAGSGYSEWVVIEDYVHHHGLKIAALVALNLVAAALAVTAIVSIVTISLRG
jgi:succinate dehydrogenase / fumarate reductase membrane anchor subunit